ncbi:metallopeptidase family protein [Candidatus Uhrbacteria bacterium]|nr:metallopeptidase family protein [Candidatus Uhrbacteria bacterium]
MPQSDETFSQFVAEAITMIPEHFRARLRNVAICIAPAPTPEQRMEFGMDSEEDMYGCYEGIPLTERDTDGEPILPDRIIIFQRVLEKDFGHDPELLRREIALTIRHEIAHHFGIEDDQLEDMESSWVDRGVVP